ncbi:MAG: hypothetical protein P8H22_09815 [Glaciecola sp.]|nr:hypothetical protein [Glaciecola sp.]
MGFFKILKDLFVETEKALVETAKAVNSTATEAKRMSEEFRDEVMLHRIESLEIKYMNGSKIENLELIRILLKMDSREDVETIKKLAIAYDLDITKYLSSFPIRQYCRHNN